MSSYDPLDSSALERAVSVHVDILVLGKGKPLQVSHPNGTRVCCLHVGPGPRSCRMALTFRDALGSPGVHKRRCREYVRYGSYLVVNGAILVYRVVKSIL